MNWSNRHSFKLLKKKVRITAQNKAVWPGTTLSLLPLLSRPPRPHPASGLLGESLSKDLGHGFSFHRAEEERPRGIESNS